jgi:hypothetical protein
MTIHEIDSQQLSIFNIDESVALDSHVLRRCAYRRLTQKSKILVVTHLLFRL